MKRGPERRVFPLENENPLPLGPRASPSLAGARINKSLSAIQKCSFAKTFFSEGRGSVRFAGGFFL